MYAIGNFKAFDYIEFRLNMARRKLSVTGVSIIKNKPLCVNLMDT
jgi:hypothetical protein